MNDDHIARLVGHARDCDDSVDDSALPAATIHSRDQDDAEHLQRLRQLGVDPDDPEHALVVFAAILALREEVSAWMSRPDVVGAFVRDFHAHGTDVDQYLIQVLTCISAGRTARLMASRILGEL